MSHRWIAGFGLASLLAAGVVFAQQPAGGGAGEAVAPVTTPNANFKTLKGQSSYAIGVDIARGLQQQGMDVDPALVSRGIADTLAGGKLLLTDKELQATMLQVQKDAVTRAQQNFVKLADKNKKEGAAFLAQNKNREGVKTTASGLQYKVLKTGQRGYAAGDRRRHGQLSRHFPRRHGVRQFLRPQRAGQVSLQSGHRRLGRSSAVDARRRQMADLCSVQSGLRRSRDGKRHSAECYAGL